MNIVVSVKGRFHGFYLAKELQDAGHLTKLITSYPKFETIKYGIKKSLIRSLMVNEALERIWRKNPDWIKNIFNTQYFFHELYDKRAAGYLPSNANLLVAWSSSALHSIRKAKQYGMITIVERGSSHIQYQKNILAEEYERVCSKTPVTHHPRVVEKELKEYQEADYISVPSRFVKQTMLDRGVPEKKLIHVPYGVDLTHFKPHTKLDNIFRVLFCGALSIRKGLPYLLQAFYELNLPQSELCLIGSPQNETKFILERYKSDKIIVKGVHPEFELARYYSQGSVFCMPSVEEGLCMVIPQAMACGLPVICTTNTGGDDIVRDGIDGFVIPIRSVDAIKEKLLAFYENPELRSQMSESAMNRVSAHFTWSDYGSRIITQYKDLLSKKDEK